MENAQVSAFSGRLVSMANTESTLMAGAGRSAPKSPPDRDGGGNATRVIPWSGPTGWRATPPVLLARRFAAGAGNTDAAFSMVELMVVLLVLGVLLAIAIPTFLGTQNAADDRSAQSNLNTTLTDAKTQFENNGQTYFINGVQDSAGFATALTTAQLGLGFKAGATGTAITQGSSGVLSSISVSVSADGNGLVLAAYSVPGNCFYIVDNAQTLGGSTVSVAPYTGTTAVTNTWTVAPAGTIGLPTGAGTTYIEVKGDTTKTDCNAYSPTTSGSPATIKSQTAGFPG
jgi:type IV pilus assembly protein PilA